MGAKAGELLAVGMALVIVVFVVKDGGPVERGVLAAMVPLAAGLWFLVTRLTLALENRGDLKVHAHAEAVPPPPGGEVVSALQRCGFRELSGAVDVLIGLATIRFYAVLDEAGTTHALVVDQVAGQEDWVEAMSEDDGVVEEVRKDWTFLILLSVLDSPEPATLSTVSKRGELLAPDAGGDLRQVFHGASPEKLVQAHRSALDWLQRHGLSARMREEYDVVADLTDLLARQRAVYRAAPFRVSLVSAVRKLLGDPGRLDRQRSIRSRLEDLLGRRLAA